MLCLAQQVSGADLSIHRVVGQQERLGRARKQVDADPSIQLPLGLGHKGIAGPDEQVDGIHELGPQSQ